MQEKLREKVVKLNKLAKERAFGIDDLDWNQKVSRDKDWTPPEMVPLAYLPSYDFLTQAQKKRFNQLYGLSICEQFIWLEETLLAGVLDYFLEKDDLDPELRTALTYFSNEEKKHSEMFFRVLEKSEPAWYKDRKLQIFKTNFIHDILFGTICKFPEVFMVWVWLALFFEERTVDFSRKYQKIYAKTKDEEVDFNFWQVHYYHMLDEARHHQMDEVLLERFYDKAAGWRRSLTGWMFKKILFAYLGPKRNAKKILDIMSYEFSDLTPELVSKLKAELPLLREHAKFQEVNFGKAAIGATLKLIADYPEMDGVWDIIQTADKKDFKLEKAWT